MPILARLAAAAAAALTMAFVPAPAPAEPIGDDGMIRMTASPSQTAGTEALGMETMPDTILTLEFE